MKQFKTLLLALGALLLCSNAMADSYYVLFHYNGTVSGGFYCQFYNSSWTSLSSVTMTNGLPSDISSTTQTALETVDSSSDDWYYAEIPSSLTSAGGYALVYISGWSWQTCNITIGITQDVYYYDYTATSNSGSFVLVGEAGDYNYDQSDHTIYLDGDYIGWSGYTNYAFTEVSKTEYTLTIDLSSDSYTTDIYNSTDGSTAIKFVIDGGWWGLADGYNIKADADPVELSTSGGNVYLTTPTGSQVTITITVSTNNFYVAFTNVGSTSVYLSCAALGSDDSWGTEAFEEQSDGSYSLTTAVSNLYDEDEGYLAFKIVIGDSWYGLADADGEDVYNIACNSATALGSDNSIYLDPNVDISSTSTLTLTVALGDDGSTYYLTVEGGCTNTAIEAVEAEVAEGPLPVYSISGAYITTVTGLDDAALKALPKGLYIVGGQRYLAK